MALVADIHLRDTRANQPVASVDNEGFIYCVTDEGNILERSNGSAWQVYSPIGGGGGITSLNSQTGSTQTFAKTDDTNVSLTISSAANVHTFILGWLSRLSLARFVQASAGSRLLGRRSGSSGDFEELSVDGSLNITSTTLQRSALTGDITASAGNNATTIANEAVTTAKIADANVTLAKLVDASAASRLLGRGSAAGSGDYQEITLGTGLTMTGTVLSSSGGAGGTLMWSSTTSRTTGISAQNLNAGANILGSEIDNATNKDQWCDISAAFSCTSSPTDGTELEVYILYAADGTNYQDGDASPTDPKGGYVGSFVARNLTTTQRPAPIQVRLKPFKFKVLVKSELDQNITNTSLTVELRTYNEETV